MYDHDIQLSVISVKYICIMEDANHYKNTHVNIYTLQREREAMVYMPQ